MGIVISVLYRAAPNKEIKRSLQSSKPTPDDLARYAPVSQKDAEEMDLQVLWSRVNSEMAGLKFTEVDK